MTGNRISVTLLMIILLLGNACSEDDDPSEETDAAQLMSQLMGEYQVEGIYGTTAIDPFTLLVEKVDNTTLSVRSGSPATTLPTFAITNWFIGFQDANDPDDYIIFTDAVGPNDGTVSLALPDAEIAVSVEIQQANSSTTRLLSLSGTKIQ